MNINIDIIIPTTNKRDKILSLISALKNQTLKPRKIYILNTLDNNEEDLLTDIMGGDDINSASDKAGAVSAAVAGGINIEEIKVNKKDFNHGSTRNIGAKKSDADYIIFMTDDAMPCDNTLIDNLYDGMIKEIALKERYKTTPAASYARQIANDNASFVEKKVREFNYKDVSFENNLLTWGDRGIKNIFLSNVCAIYDRKILESLGYFEENVDFNEDTLFADKAIKNGYSIIYNAEAKVYHSHDYSFKEQYDRNVLIGRSHKEYPQVFGVYKAEGEGKKLVMYVCAECIKHFKIKDMIKFLIECYYRYKGYRKGKE